MEDLAHPSFSLPKKQQHPRAQEAAAEVVEHPQEVQRNAANVVLAGSTGHTGHRFQTGFWLFLVGGWVFIEPTS